MTLQNEIELKKALKKDFNTLYQGEATIEGVKSEGKCK